MSPRKDLKILSWNIHKGIGGVDRVYDLKRIARLIEHESPDIALLQEVADGWPATDFHDQAILLSEMTNFEHVAFHQEHRFRKGGYGNAILSRFPLEDSNRMELKCGWRKKRGATLAEALIPTESGELRVMVASVHLGLAETERRRQLRSLLGPDSSLKANMPTIVGGDFNDVYDTVEGFMSRERRLVRAGQRTRTFPAAFPMLSLDGIFTSHLQLISAATTKNGLTKSASDHLPLIAVLALPSSEAR